MSRPVRLGSRCWEVASEPDPDSGWPHYSTEHEARSMVEEYEDLKATVTLLPSPCWEALCENCGSVMANDEYGHVHYSAAVDAEQDDDTSCSAGCERPLPDRRLEPSSAGMETIPGITDEVPS